MDPLRTIINLGGWAIIIGAIAVGVREQRARARERARQAALRLAHPPKPKRPT